MENPTENEISMKENILRKIDTQEISMRSRSYFVLESIALGVLTVIVLALSASIFNFIFFSIRLNDHSYLLSFGPQGFWLFVKVFPWLSLAADIVLVGILQWLLRRYRFTYRLPVLYVLGALIVLGALLGFILDRGTPLNDRLLHEAEMSHLPRPINAFYSNFREPAPDQHGVCDCIITAINGSIITAYQKNNPERVIPIAVPPTDPLLSTLQSGDEVFVAGNYHDGALHSFGLRRTEDIQAVPAKH